MFWQISIQFQQQLIRCIQEAHTENERSTQPSFHLLPLPVSQRSAGTVHGASAPSRGGGKDNDCQVTACTRNGEMGSLQMFRETLREVVDVEQGKTTLECPGPSLLSLGS